MTDKQIARKRLHHQHLVSRPLRDVAAIVRRLGAMQAQDYPNAKWAIGLRGNSIGNDDVDAAFAAGMIIRLHILRPTWHFVAADDLRWLLALTAPRVMAATAAYSRSLELDRAVFRKSHAALERALRDGNHLTRGELSNHLERARLGKLTSQRVGVRLMQGELDGVVCSGAPRGKQQTYALLDERVPPTPARERDESLLDLTLRYFSTRGPASPHDFAWWSGLTVPDARRGIDIAGKSLGALTHNGKALWLADQDGVPPRAGKSAHLLPNYDEYFVGFKDRSAIADRLRKVVTNARVDALMGHVVVVDGQLVGGWRRTLGTSLTIEIAALTAVTAPERKLIDAATRQLGEFHALPATVHFRSRETR